MGTLTIVSDRALTEEYLNALGECVEASDELDYDDVEVFHGGQTVPPRKHLLAVGKLLDPFVIPENQPIVYAPSSRELVNTANGLTRLMDSLLLLDKIRRRPLPPEHHLVKPGMTVQANALSGLFAAIDIEVSGDVDVDEPEDTDLLSVSCTVKAETGYITWVYGRDALQDEMSLWDLSILLSGCRLIMHNGKFDARWLNRLVMDRLGAGHIYPHDDTMLMHHSLYPAGKHGLKQLAQNKLGAPDWEADIKKHTKRKAHFETIPDEVLTRYNAGDTFYTYLLWELLGAELEGDPNARKAYDFEMRMSRMYQEVEAHGVYVDVEYGKQVGEALSQQREELLEQLREMVGAPTFNPGSHVQVKKFLAEWGWPMGSTDEKNLQMLMMRNEPDSVVTRFCLALLEFRGVAKLLSTYVVSVLKKVRNGRVHPSFLVHGTSTGRTSSKGPNIQNLPNDEEGVVSIRRMFGAAPEYVLVGADYAQAELRTMAELSDDEQMIADLQEDSADFFDNMMPKVFPDVDFDKVSAKERKGYRLRLKRVVYGTSYGLTAPSIALQLTLAKTPTTVEEAQKIQDGYLGIYPKLREWRENTMPNLLRDGLTTVFGRRFQQDIISDGMYHRIQNQAWAFMPQSTASDICVLAALELHEDIKQQGLDAHIVATIHDAIYVECEPNIAEQMQAMVEQHMRDAAAQHFSRVPFLTDSHVGQFMDEL